MNDDEQPTRFDEANALLAVVRNEELTALSILHRMRDHELVSLADACDKLSQMAWAQYNGRQDDRQDDRQRPPQSAAYAGDLR